MKARKGQPTRRSLRLEAKSSATPTQFRPFARSESHANRGIIHNSSRGSTSRFLEEDSKLILKKKKKKKKKEEESRFCSRSSADKGLLSCQRSSLATDPLSSKLQDSRKMSTHQSPASIPTDPRQNNEMEAIKSASRRHLWHWNKADQNEDRVISDDCLEVCFHPRCSESADAVRGSEALNRDGNYYYWEVTVFDKAYGTSVMFGLCTSDQRLRVPDYCNLVGLDGNGWSLSHKGFIWHNGHSIRYTSLFPTNQTVTLGLLFNTMRGELSYFINGKNLGVAFSGLNNVNRELFPVVGSTAKGTRVRLTGAYCGYMSLLERSCFRIIKTAQNNNQLVKYLKDNRVPQSLINYMADNAKVCGGQTKNNTAQEHDQYDCNIDQQTNSAVISVVV